MSQNHSELDDSVGALAVNKERTDLTASPASEEIEPDQHLQAVQVVSLHQKLNSISPIKKRLEESDKKETSPYSPNNQGITQMREMNPGSFRRTMSIEQSTPIARSKDRKLLSKGATNNVAQNE